MRRPAAFRVFALTTIFLGSLLPLHAIAAKPATGPAAQVEVFVIGTLYRRHEQVPAYGTDVLRKMIVAVEPDVLVLDVTPEELANKKVHASKIEYPQVIFPLAESGRYAVYAAEPAKPMFDEITQGIGKAMKELAEKKPEVDQALKAQSDATYTALKLHWTSPAKAHDAVTATATSSKIRLRGALVGPVMESGDARWDQHTADVALRAAQEHPGKRILVLTGIENRPFVSANLARAGSVKMIDMEAWLQANGFGN
ncbi:MAG TPA: hypothetical protein VGD21_00650 [Lysobacter sp.]